MFEFILSVFLLGTGIGAALLIRFEELVPGLKVELKAIFFPGDVVNRLSLFGKLVPSILWRVAATAFRVDSI